jgi:polysaccharide deacetylase 2 family uncharacterized protein YibQ
LAQDILSSTTPQAMLKAPTFARRPAAGPPAVSESASLPIPPALGAGAAVALLLATGAVLIAVLGDPSAGAPKVRVSLTTPKTPNAALVALRQRLGLDGSTPALDAPAPGQARTPATAQDPLTQQIAQGAATGESSSEAVITLPQGGSLGGGEPRVVQAPREPLPAAPIAGLSALSPQGPLPIISKDGRTPFQAYARPFHDNGKPKVSLIIGGLGLNAAATRTAIERLPPEVTLSFVPYADSLQAWIDLARADGHEVLLEVPMEPLDYPNNDPGPSTLLVNSSHEEMTRRLEWILSRATGYFGVTNYLGGRFMSADQAMNVFTSALRGRGLGFLDDGSAGRRPAAGVPRASADAIVDEQLSADAIDHQLNALGADAQQKGQALGAGFAYPVTLTEVLRWTQGLNAKGLQLAPASALAHR